MLPFLVLAVLAPLAAMAAPTDAIAKTSRRTLREEAVGAFNDLAQQSGLEPVLSRATGKPVQDLFQKLLAQVPDADLQALRDARSKWCDNGGAALPEVEARIAEAGADAADQSGTVPAHRQLQQEFYKPSRGKFRLQSKAC